MIGAARGGWLGAINDGGRELAARHARLNRLPGGVPRARAAPHARARLSAGGPWGVLGAARPTRRAPSDRATRRRARGAARRCSWPAALAALGAPEPTTTNRKKPSMMEFTELFSFCGLAEEGAARGLVVAGRSEFSGAGPRRQRARNGPGSIDMLIQASYLLHRLLAPLVHAASVRGALGSNHTLAGRHLGVCGL